MCGFNTTTPGKSPSQALSSWGVLALVGLLFSGHLAVAAPVGADTATRAVQGWLHQDRRPLGKPMSARIKSTEAVRNVAGETIYYVVRLEPAGFVVLAADDGAEPIVAFSASGRFDASSGSPLAALVNRDMPRRVARARAGGLRASALKAQRKWRAFLAGSPNPPPDSEENGSIVVASQIQVAPFVQTLWNQTVDASGNVACYNYYTPPYAPGTASNYPCGCVATALAQEMFYFQYPNRAVGAAGYSITIDGAPQVADLLGGDGVGGVYQWNQMPLSPNGPSSNQAMAIGALTHDAAAAVNMDYTSNNSSAFTHLAQQALTRTFQFANAAYYENDASGITGANLLSMINPNLDARLPVILGIEPDGGHCLVCDGYGYSSLTLFHHLNAGFGGDDDIWYALPEVNTIDGNGDFNTVAACVYNIYTNGGGQIISGRVTDPAGAPVAGATVTASRKGGGTYSALTDTNGVYALTRIPGQSTYALTATNPADFSATGKYSTGTAVFDQLPSGNVWGANFVLSPPLLATPESGFASIGPAGGPFNVMGQDYTLTNSSASSISWTTSNPPLWLSVSPTNGPVAAGGVSSLSIFLNSSTGGLASGTYSGSIWITNLNNGFAQALAFSLSVNAADYPIAVTGYNRDVVVENTAVGGNTINYADAFDPVDALIIPSGPACFYEAGLLATNLPGGGSSVEGLPPGGLLTNEVDDATTFQLASYNSNNVLYLTAGAPSGSLTLSQPTACKSLSVLAASAQGGGDGTLVIHFADGTAISNLSFNATQYLTTNAPDTGAAVANFGVLVVGDFVEFGSLDASPSFPGYPYPTLYQTSINLESLGLTEGPIVSLTFTRPSGDGATTNTVTGVFAVNGTQAPYAVNYVLGVSASPDNGGTVSGAGVFQPGSWQKVTATPNNGFEFIGWSGDATGATSSMAVTMNTNLNITAHFAANSTNITLTVLTNGDGIVSPNLNGRNLKVNYNYTLTAKAGSGNVFSNWTGSITTGKNPLTVRAESSMVLQANFVTNPFSNVKGTYNGLFFSSSTGVTEQTSGMLKGLTISRNGSYSGTVLINGGSHAISGKFNLAGQAISHISRPPGQGGPVAVTMTLNWNISPPQLTGIVAGTNTNQSGWEADLTAFYASNALPPAAYTMLIPPDNDNAPPCLSPGGYGYALITNQAGTARITGALADGIAFNQTVPVSQDGYVPVCANLYAGKGLLLGWINLELTNAEASNISGLTWIRPSRASGRYTNGFNNVLPGNQVLLSLWTNSPNSVLANLTNLSMRGTINDTNVLANMAVTTTAAGKVNGPLVIGAINLKTGQFKVTVGSGANKTNGCGAILLSEGAGGGYFLTKTNAQSIQLGP